MEEQARNLIAEVEALGSKLRVEEQFNGGFTRAFNVAGCPGGEFPEELLPLAAQMRELAMREAVVAEMIRQGRAKLWQDPEEETTIGELWKRDASGAYVPIGECVIQHHLSRRAAAT